MTNLFSKRFAELQAEAEQLEASKKNEYNALLSRPVWQINNNALLHWKVKAKSLLARACGEESQHFKEFIESESSLYSTGLENLYRMIAVFSAAREDFDGGYLTTVRSLVQAELFDSELEQARELLRNGYKTPAAVIAGTVLETSLRELCSRKQMPPGNPNRLPESEKLESGAWEQKAEIWEQSGNNKRFQERFQGLCERRGPFRVNKLGIAQILTQ